MWVGGVPNKVGWRVVIKGGIEISRINNQRRMGNQGLGIQYVVEIKALKSYIPSYLKSKNEI